MSLSKDDHPIRPRWTHVLPIPNDDLIATVNGPGLENYYAIGEAYAGVVFAHLPKGAWVLDVGCGCGKLARFLRHDRSLEAYVGFDVIRESVEWCRDAFRHVNDNRFEFVHADVVSDVYNPGGKVKAVEYEFPVGDGWADVVVAASLFTHLLEDECLHYLQEISRVLEDGGRAVVSVHCEPEEGEHWSGDRARADVDVGWFVEEAGRVGLELVDAVDFRQRVLVFGKVARGGTSER